MFSWLPDQSAKGICAKKIIFLDLFAKIIIFFNLIIAEPKKLCTVDSIVQLTL